MRPILTATLCIGLAAAAHAQTKPADPIGHPVRFGIMTDMSGPLAALAGPGAVLAGEMAAEDCLAAECAGMTIEVISADHQNKPDIAVGIFRDWVDNKGVTAVGDIIQASVQIAIQHEAAAKNKIALFSGGTSRLTNEDCAPATSVMWMWDTYGQAIGITKPLAKPGSKWFTIVADYAFGVSLEQDSAKLIKAAGGEVVGAIRHPFGFTGDFSSFLLQAQGSPANIIAIGSSGSDLVTMLKQAREFGIGASKKQALASFVLTTADVSALGLETTQGVLTNEAFYWNLDDATRAFSRRFAARNKGRMPTTIQAGDYAVARAYFAAVAAAKTTDTAPVIAKLHELPVSGPLIKNGSIRPDGRVVHDTYLFRVKKPSESREPYDFYDLVATIPAAEAFRPLADTACPALMTTAAAK